MTEEQLQQKFEAEMQKQNRCVKKDARGHYQDYASAVMWSWVQWGFRQRVAK